MAALQAACIPRTAAVSKVLGESAALWEQCSCQRSCQTYGCSFPRREALSDEAQVYWLERHVGVLPEVLSRLSPHEAEAVIFCAGLITWQLSLLRKESTVASYQAHLSRPAFTRSPFARKLEKSTCGGTNRYAGVPLNIGDTSSFEALHIRVAADGRQRDLLERCLRLAGGAALLLVDPSVHNSNFKHWMADDRVARLERMFYIPHVVVVVNAALAACSAGYGAAGAVRTGGEILQMTWAVFGGKSARRVLISDAQHDALQKGGVEQADTAHYIGELLGSAQSGRCMAAIPVLTSFFANTLDTQVYIGVGANYHLTGSDGLPIFMVPDASNLVSEEFAGPCPSCESDGVDSPPTVVPCMARETVQGECDTAVHPIFPQDGYAAPDVDIANGRRQRSHARLQDRVDTMAVGAITRLHEGKASRPESFFVGSMPAGAVTQTCTMPPRCFVHRSMTYVPDIAAHESDTRNSKLASQEAGNVRGNLRRDSSGLVLLLGGLRRGAATFAASVDSLVARLGETGWMQRTEFAMHYRIPATLYNTSELSSDPLPAAVHSSFQLLYGGLFNNAAGYTHEFLADWITLEAATAVALLVAHVTLLRDLPGAADRLEAAAGLADTAHWLLHFFDGRFQGEAKQAIRERGLYTGRRISDLAMHMFNPQYVVRPALRSQPFRSESSRARAMVILSRMGEVRLQRAYDSRAPDLHAMERPLWYKCLTRVLGRLLAAVPVSHADRASGEWLLSCYTSMHHDDVMRRCVRCVGTGLLDDFATEVLGDREVALAHREAVWSPRLPGSAEHAAAVGKKRRRNGQR